LENVVKKLIVPVIAIVLFVLAAFVLVPSAKAGDECRRNTTRYQNGGYYTNYTRNRQGHCNQNYSRNYDCGRNYGSSCGSSYYSARPTVCSSVVTYTYQPATTVCYVRRPVRPTFSIRIVID
jgi:hypothetical protein